MGKYKKTKNKQNKQKPIAQYSAIAPKKNRKEEKENTKKKPIHIKVLKSAFILPKKKKKKNKKTNQIAQYSAISPKKKPKKPKKTKNQKKQKIQKQWHSTVLLTKKKHQQNFQKR